MLSDGKTNALNCEEEELVNRKLCHLNQTANKRIRSILRKYPEGIANSFEDVRLSTVSVTHRFELTFNEPLYRKARSISPMHNKLVRKEVDRMFAA